MPLRSFARSHSSVNSSLPAGRISGHCLSISSKNQSWICVWILPKPSRNGGRTSFFKYNLVRITSFLPDCLAPNTFARVANALPKSVASIRWFRHPYRQRVDFPFQQTLTLTLTLTSLWTHQASVNAHTSMRGRAVIVTLYHYPRFSILQSKAAPVC